MDEPIEGGGSFDATGAFLGADDRYISKRMRNADNSHTITESSMEGVEHKLHSSSSNEKDQSLSDLQENDSINDIDECAKMNSNENLSVEQSLKDESNQIDMKEQSPSEIEDITKLNQDHVVLESAHQNVNVEKLLTSNEKDSPPTPTTTDRMQEVAEDIEKLIMDDDQSCNENDSLLTSHIHHDSRKHTNNDDILSNKSKEKGDLADHWYYRDPQGKIQGPFTATEMLEWYKAGYFDENLYVKRVCDAQFLALGDLLKLCSGSIPFVSMPPIVPQLIQNSNSDISLSTGTNVQPPTPTKPLNHLVHSAKLPPQPTANNPNLSASLNQTLLDDSVQHMHPVQKQFFLNQQALAIKQLSETEPWNIMNPSEQAALIAQRMAQNQSPNDILQSQAIPVQNPLLNHLMGSASSKALPKHPNPHIGNLPNALGKQAAHLKNQQQTQSLQHILNQHKKDSFNAADSANGNNVPVMMHSVDPVHHMLNSIGMNHQQISPPVNVLPVTGIPPPQQQSQNHGQNMVENNPLKSLLIQLSMQSKPLGGPPNNILQPHNHHTPHQQPPTSHIHSHLNENRLSMPNTHTGLWDMPMPPTMQSNQSTNLPSLHNNLVPSSSMKTEMQIIEQHLHAKAKEDQLKLEQLSAQHMDQWKKQQQQNQEFQKTLMKQKEVHYMQQQQPQPPSQQQQTQAPPSHIVPPPQQQQLHHQPQIMQMHPPQQIQVQPLPTDLIQQSDIFKAKNDNVKDDLLDLSKIGSKVVKGKIDLKSAVEARAPQNINIKHDIQNEEILMAEAKAAKAKNAAVLAAKQLVEPKFNQKVTNVAIINDSNNKLAAAATAPKNQAKESTKKKGKEKDQKLSAQALEEKKRQEEEERQMIEEKKRLELIAAQRKAKLVDQNTVRNESNAKRNNLAASVAPWSNLAEVGGSNTNSSQPLTLAEIQKAERERRSEIYRLEQAQQQTQALLDQQQQKDAVLKWKLKPQNQAKSLAEIQAEESKARQSIQQITTNVRKPHNFNLTSAFS